MIYVFVGNCDEVKRDTTDDIAQSEQTTQSKNGLSFDKPFSNLMEAKTYYPASILIKYI